MINITKSKQQKGKFYYTDKNLKNETKKKLKEEFFNLCYLCEERRPKGFQIEHFYPKGKNYFPEKINCWNNLFLVCGTCNTVRPKYINSEKDKEVYNNCIDDVENLIILHCVTENEQIKIKSTENTTKAKNTVNLLERIYNGKGNSESVEYLELQEEIINKINLFQKAFDSFKNNKNKILKRHYKNIIIEFIQKKYNLRTENIDYNRVGFISFKRQIIKDDNPKYFEEFKQYFD